MATEHDSARALEDVVDRLASFEPGEQPVLSLYLDTRANQHGRDQFEPFLRKELSERGRTFGASSKQREAFEKDAQRIREWLGRELQPSADGVAVFACSEQGLFEATQLDVPIAESRLVVAPQPFVYPLVQMIEQNPRYAALLADTNLARLYVFGLSTRLRAETVQSPKTKGHKVGGWSQMRFQRHIKDQYKKHAKEVVDVLARVVREESIDHVVLAGDEVVLPLLREQLPAEITAKVIDTLSLDIRTPEHEVLAQTLASLRRKDAETDAERVEEVFDEYRAGGLAVVGAAACLGALAIGQVHELLLDANPQALRWTDEGEAGESARDTATVAVDEGTLPEVVASASPGAGSERPQAAELADTLVRLAQQTDAAVKLIEDASLLQSVGGVAAALRFRLDRSNASAEQQAEKP
jgi:peptide chain release factor subunit 1